MSSRRKGQEPPDELDWLLSDALHAMVRAVEPSPRVWQTIRATVMAEPHRQGARARSPFQLVIDRLSSWLAAGQMNQALGSEGHRSSLPTWALCYRAWCGAWM